MRRPSLPILALSGLCVLALSAEEPGQKKAPWDGSRLTPVHLLPVKDEFNQIVVPGESYPLPLSSRFTCAPCHDYDAVRAGWHFNADAPGAIAGRPGEPWIWVDEPTGTLLPLTYRGWRGTWHPAALGLSAWDVTRLFGRHMTGGGPGEPSRAVRSPGSRWEVSGDLEVNCLGCHNASRRQSHSEWAKQVLRENYRWAATAAAGLGEVGGMASRLPATWDVIDGTNPDDTEYAVVPAVDYDAARFDGGHRVFLDIVHRPEDNRCLACHSVSPVGASQFAAQPDVHSAAGIRCADCHRNDLGHGMIRGYEGEAEEYDNPVAAEFTCRGCHIGPDEARRGGAGVGRLGAPDPLHKGFPKVHFERLACTVCHSGPLPAPEPTRVRTARANRLGIYGVARWDTDLPALQSPVLQRDRSGRLAPHRLFWPAFWGVRDGEEVIPLRPEEVARAAGERLRCEARTAGLLAALMGTVDLKGEPVLITAGRVYRLNLDGGLDVAEHSGDAPENDPFWGVRGEAGLEPLVPDFDPEAETPDQDAEIRIQNVLESLAAVPDRPGEPILVRGAAVYRIIEGYLEKRVWDGEPASLPELGWLGEGVLIPLVSEFDLRTVRETTGREQVLTEEQVQLVLAALSETQDGDVTGRKFVYVAGGRTFFLNDGGGLADRADDPAADAVAWPLAHGVRPARQSLGINGCTDCHSAGSDFFFASVRGTGPLVTDRIRKNAAVSFMGMTQPYQRLFGLSFTVRPILKWVLGAVGILVALVLLLAAALAVGRWTGLLEKRR